MKHTPTPWELYDGSSIYSSRPHCIGQGEYGHVATFETAEDAEFCLTACNAHDDLVALAKQFERVAEYEIRRAQKDGDDEGVRLRTVTLNMIRAALDKAETP